LPDLFHVLLAHRRGLHCRLLQVRRTHYMRGSFCQKVLRKRENRGKNERCRHSGYLLHIEMHLLQTSSEDFLL
jgi:hypothetical protein